MLRPGMETYFQEGSNFIEDIRSRRELWKAAGVMEFVQEPGQIIFVPSGWYHQVHNLEDSISINHNVINAYNIDILVNLMKERLADVKEELQDVEQLGVYTAQEFQKQCQV
uniref:Jumonji domain-containing protein 4 n=1 Tax=Ditylenchus dipsaci TaxID=166011 RepID=A0A915EKE9_9BILA